MNIKELAESIFTENPTRFKKKEKSELLEKAKGFLTENGWGENEIKIQKFKGSMKSQNLIIGDPASAEYIVTAHYDTPGRNGFMLGSSKLLGQTGANIVLLLFCLPVCALGGVAGRMLARYEGTSFEPVVFAVWMFVLLGFMAFMFIPMFLKNKNNRNDNTSGVIAVLDSAVRAAADPALKGKCCFVLFDNEEWGLIGSMQFAKWCKKNGVNLNDKTNINIDCVGIGEHLYAARTNSRKTDKQKAVIEKLIAAGLEIKEKQSSMVYMSDHANLKNSYMLCYMNRSKLGAPYIPNIHTSKDKVCDVDKVLDLSAKVIEAIKA